MTTSDVVQAHIEAVLFGNLDAILQDYTKDSVIMTAQTTITGIEQIRKFFVDFRANMPPGFVEAVTILRRESAGDVAFIVWDAAPFIAFATDTFLIRDGKIIVQTFAMQVQ